MTTASSNFPLFGLWQPEDQLKHLYYGHSCFEKHLLSILPSQSSKVFIITGNSISTKKPLLQKLEALLGNRHARTFSNIKQHALVAQVDQASEIVAKDPSIDTILSLGGGSPIDSAKKISFRTHEKNGKFLTHLTIPTTLIAAECTAAVGYTKADGKKTGLVAPELALAPSSTTQAMPNTPLHGYGWPLACVPWITLWNRCISHMRPRCRGRRCRFGQYQSFSSTYPQRRHPIRTTRM